MSTSLTRMNPNTMPDAGKAGYSQISVTNPGKLAFVSGQVAWAADDTPVPETLEEQTRQVLKNLSSALRALEATPQEIVQMRIFATDFNDETLNAAMAQIMGFLDGSQPSLTGIGVVALAGPDLKIEIEMVVQVPE